MNANELYKAGKLQEAIDAQIQEVKAKPADQGKRVFLFELLMFAGDVDRARKQIQAITYSEVELMAQAAAYNQLLDAEVARRKLFTDGTPPNFLTKPPEHVQIRLEALARLREKKPREAAELLTQPVCVSHAMQGTLNDKSFELLYDCDDRFGSVLEVMSKGSYFWVPLEQVEALAANPPKYPRDLLYFPAYLEVHNGPAGDVFLPVLYPFSHEHPDNTIKLGRDVEWKQDDGAPVIGVGRRQFLVGDDPISLLEWRQLEMVQPEIAPAPEE